MHELARSGAARRGRRISCTEVLQRDLCSERASLAWRGASRFAGPAGSCLLGQVHVPSGCAGIERSTSPAIRWRRRLRRRRLRRPLLRLNLDPHGSTINVRGSALRVTARPAGKRTGQKPPTSSCSSKSTRLAARRDADGCRRAPKIVAEPSCSEAHGEADAGLGAARHDAGLSGGLLVPRLANGVDHRSARSRVPPTTTSSQPRATRSESWRRRSSRSPLDDAAPGQCRSASMPARCPTASAETCAGRASAG